MGPELEITEAAPLSQFLKRISFSEFRTLSYNDEEAYKQQEGAEKIRMLLLKWVTIQDIYISKRLGFLNSDKIVQL